MRLTVLLFVPVLFGAETVKLPPLLQSISDLAASAPPEFTADALLRIVESGKLADKNARRALIEQAFQVAISAKLPVRMVALPGTVTDTLSGTLDQAYKLRLDVLSLQSRAVRDMLPLDPAKTRELFSQIIRPAIVPPTCDDTLVYEPSDYYQALTAVVNGAFTPKERAKDAHFNLLLDAMGQVTSPSQLAPLTAAVQGVTLTEPQRLMLSARLDGMAQSFRQQKDHACPSAPKVDRYWQSATAKQLLEAGKKLRFASSTQLLTDSDRSTPEWQQQLDAYLNLIADWSADQEPSEAVYYHERCLVYTSLLDLVPEGPESDKILADYVDFVSNSGLYRTSPAEWYVQPNTVLGRARNEAARSQVLAAFRRSGNPILMLAVALDSAFSRT